MKSETDYNLTDRFFEAFNSQRCKTALLAITVLVVTTYCLTVLFQVPNDGIKEVVIILIGIWVGRTLKDKDKNLSFDEYKMVKLVKRVIDEEKK